MLDTNKCKSCDNQFTGTYCNVCGEKVVTEDDKKLKHFVGEFINAVSFADSKFWRTLKSIALKPGAFSKDFVSGKRKKYMRPIALFLFANLIYFFFPLFNTLHSSLGTQTTAQNFFYSELAYEMVIEKVENSDVSLQEYQTIYNAKTKELSKVFLILLVLIQSLFTWIFHNPKKGYLSENVVLSLEFMTYVILFAIQLQGIIAVLFRSVGYGHLISEALITFVAIFLIFYFLIKAEFSFYGSSKVMAGVNSIIGVICFAFAVSIYRAFLFFITFWST